MSKIDKIFKKFKIERNDDHDTYVENMLKLKYGKKFMDLIDEMNFLLSESSSENHKEIFNWKKLYNTLRKNPKVAELVIKTEWELFEHLLDWILKQNLKPKLILELGSGVGLLSFMLSELFNQVETHGIENSFHCVNTAKKLAVKYNSLQCKFYHLDINDKESFKNLPIFDIIIAPFFFHEVMYHNEPKWNFINQNLKNVSDLKSTLITINRFPNKPKQCIELTSNLEKGCFEQSSQQVLNTGFEVFPIQIFKRKNS